MGARQCRALSLCAFTVPAIVLLPRGGWLGGGLAAGLAAAVLLFGRRGGDLTARAARTMLGRGALWLLFAWNLVALGAGARLLCGIFPDGNVLVGLLLLLLSAYAAARGRVAPVGAICFFFVIILYSILFGFALPELNAVWLAPNTPDWWLLPAGLVSTCALWLHDGRKARGVGGWLICGAGVAVLAGLTAVGSLSPAVAAQEAFPFYEAAKSVRILGAMERLEPLVSAALTAGGFCMLGLVCAVNERILSILAPRKKNLGASVHFFGGGALLWGSSLISGAALAVCTAIFWGILPVLIQLVVKKEKT